MIPGFRRKKSNSRGEKNGVKKPPPYATDADNSSVRTDTQTQVGAVSVSSMSRHEKFSAAALPPPPSHNRTNSATVVKKQIPSLNHFMATTPITKHYQLNNQILSAFESHYEAKLYQVAYAMGCQFVETALIEIPKHGYFYSKRHERERMQSSLDAVRVAGLLRDIQMQGDLHGVPHSEPERDRVERLQNLALEQVDRASEDQYEASRAAAEQVLYDPKKMKSKDSAETTATHEWVLLEPLLSCQDSVSNVLCPSPESTSPLGSATTTTSNAAAAVDRNVNVNMSNADPLPARVTGEVFSEREAALSNLPVAVAVPFEKHRTADSVVSSSTKPKPRLSLIEDDADHNPHRNAAVAAAAAAETASNDWIHIRRHSAEDILLEKALYLSGLEILPSTSVLPDPSGDEASIKAASDVASVASGKSELAPHPPETRLMPGKSRLQLATLSRLYHEDFESLVNTMGRIRIQYIDTFQGRLAGSVNGCTVIAPLMCIHHLLDSNMNVLPDNDGLNGETIVQVIDQETPAILNELRTSLGLSDQAFLIPADVHDYLISNGQLHTTQFRNVVGGNILDESHLQNFVTALDDNPHKLAATLFFHEHVVAVLKIRRSSRTGDCWYDIVDSLPLKETVKLVDESDAAFCLRHGLADYFEDDANETCLEETAVFRCMDSEALVAFLRWYACSKFTEENIQYIDSYEWNDAQSDFDPRVFQAFVWGAPPTL